MEVWDEKHGFICLVKGRHGDPGILLLESVLFGNDDTAIRLLKGNRAVSTLAVTLDHASLVWSANRASPFAPPLENEVALIQGVS